MNTASQAASEAQAQGKSRISMGPGALVAAAFIGPGTVTACTLAGANFGYALIWALVFATVATIILQEMTSRLGVVVQQGLGTALLSMSDNKIIRAFIVGLIVFALYVGNAAYEAGNLAGAALGADAMLDFLGYKAAIVLIALISALLLLTGTYKRIERVLIVLVLIMALCFLLNMLIVRPNIPRLLAGLVPRVPDKALFTTIALIGTTIVPYNLFLHAAAAKERWHSAKDLRESRIDAGVSIGLGGVISILIVATAASSLFAKGLEVKNAADMALQLEPTFGTLSKVLMAGGLFAAGLTSAICAPMATGYAVSEVLRLKGGVSSKGFRVIAMSVILVGTVVSFLGIKPVTIIMIAQIANGLLLPIVAVFLLVAMNKKKLLGMYVNGRVTNMLGIVVVLVALGLGLRLIIRVFT